MRICFDAYKNSEKENYNPFRVNMLWVEATQIVYIPCVACFDPFFVEQPINSWLDHIRHHKRPVPLGLQLALLVGMKNEHHVTWIDVLS